MNQERLDSKKIIDGLGHEFWYRESLTYVCKICVHSSFCNMNFCVTWTSNKNTLRPHLLYTDKFSLNRIRVSLTCISFQFKKYEQNDFFLDSIPNIILIIFGKILFNDEFTWKSFFENLRPNIFEICLTLSSHIVTFC